MARIKNSILGRDRYYDVFKAIEELGTLWVLDRINDGLAHNRKQRDLQREKRAKGKENENNVR